uniref:Uncharacterized protein n=1 Tax=Dechloromonas aromatica (strain RCB) TaxID=159087 RepID=Q47H83_DECAR
MSATNFIIITTVIILFGIGVTKSYQSTRYRKQSLKRVVIGVMILSLALAFLCSTVFGGASGYGSFLFVIWCGFFEIVSFIGVSAGAIAGHILSKYKSKDN